MKTNLYQVFDRIASMPASNIIGFPRDEAAIRWFQQALADEKTGIGQFPNDHQLLKLGQQNLDSGEIDAHLPTVVTDGITERDRAEKTWGRNPDLATEEAMKKEFERREERLNRLPAGTPAPAPAANNNNAADASAGVDLTCNTCGELWSNHRSFTSHPFRPRPELQALYDQYLRDQNR